MNITFTPDGSDEPIDLGEVKDASVTMGPACRDDLIKQVRPGVTTFSELEEWFGPPNQFAPLRGGGGIVSWKGETLSLMNFKRLAKHGLQIKLDRDFVVVSSE